MAATIPVHIADFHITPDQVGLSTNSHPLSPNIQNEILQEFAAMMVDQRKRSHRGYEQCQERRLWELAQEASTKPGGLLSMLNFKGKRARRRRPSVQSPSPAPSEYPEELMEDTQELEDTIEDTPVITDDHGIDMEAIA